MQKLNDVQTTLLAAATLINNRKDFTTETFARDEDGYPMSGYDARRDNAACRWCALGAVMAVAPTKALQSKAIAQLRSSCSELYEDTVTEISDWRPRKHIARVYAHAIQAAA